MTFWDSIDIPENLDNCWEWRSKKGSGERPYTRYKNKAWSRPRLSWFLTNGEIPEGMCVCHRCDNPSCCNPSHLFLGTIQDNVNDRERKGRNKLPQSRGEEHGQHKLTKEQVLEIRNSYKEGSTNTYRSLAKKYGLTFGAIRNIIKRKTWSWL